MSVDPKPTLFDLFRADRRAIELERASIMQSPSFKAQLSSTRDSYGALSALKMALEREPHLVLGFVGDPIAYTHFYKIRLSRQGGIIPACMATQTSHEVTGAHQLNTLLPGTMVVVMWAPHMPYGIIVGVVPQFMLSPTDAMGDRVVQGSRVGLQVDPYHNFAFSLAMGGGVIDWSGGRPNDQITAGEWGAVTETGLMVFLDSFMAMMRIDEETGIFGFYDDQMLRVAGHNMEVRSSGYERTDDDDEWEFNIEEGAVPGYLWEGRGAFDRDAVINRAIPTETVQTTEPWYAENEPALDHQQAIRRYRKFMGYLGQGYKRTLFILPEPDSADRDESSPGLLQMSDEIRFPGVAEEQWGLDGLITQRSAKGVIISKRMMLPEPKRVKLEEDTSGDTSTNYKQDGVFGEGADHKVGDMGIPACTTTNMLQAAGFLDVYAHAFNWKGLHPFHYHALDYYLPNESDYWFADLMAGGNPPFADCRSPSLGMLAPSPIMLTVDERYGQVMYFPNNSYIALLDDGGIVIGDGYGAETRMVAGNHYRTAPNDIYDLSGKNSVTWAGRDFVARGNWNVQIAANKCNMFLKAQNKLLALANKGGVLVESKATGTQFKVNTPPLAPTCSISQSGGFRNDITAACDCAGYTAPNLKEIYRICITTGGAPGAAEFAVSSFSGTDDAIGVPISAFSSPISVGAKGCTVTFDGTDDFQVGQEWTLSVTTDPNDINDEVIEGVVIRAKESTIFNYAANYEALLSHDGDGGMMIMDAGRKGMHVQHGGNIVRHTEDHLDDIFWDTGDASLIVHFEATAATKDVSHFFGSSTTYNITCIAANEDQPLNAARVSVSSSDVDSEPSLVVAVSPTLIAIGNKGFRWTPTVPNISVGDSWSYTVSQSADPCVSHWDKDKAVLCQHVRMHNLVADCVMANVSVTSAGAVTGIAFTSLTDEDASIITGETAAYDHVHDIHQSWAPSARSDLTMLKDNTEVTKMEFFFPSSFQDGTEPPWRLFESRWQQMDRNQGMAAVQWTENPVTGDDSAAFPTVMSYPWPGKYSWAIWDTYFKEDADLFQLNDNLSKDRGSSYETPELPTPAAVPFDDQWLIIENPC